ncbi:23S rRNA m(5)U-1939 methyltransferase [Pseudidiomarina planktonica]|uniref:23S rRNA m(5)U-1939 methyltransferase n=1 Tax=Pseudidiomarina planktonica TaxID=1323738 RepID=A0A1Y6EVY0_9GAMM|nr:23S rRNA (uracil(1939)-C(5))-methyltransferase RlmD [Pseudidiomarina planktonica]RUO65517.1 23S rRNA (uracil(1939)-C(5))-methyltransferase RlmD [Pseudidiomarina planktonica]SMQ64662.1 23S rRNA m(5)U-1939 methyltransferase [Pseudidiomarina planktonica]
MAQFFKPKPKLKPRQSIQNLTVSALDHQGRGVVRHEQRAYFVANTLPGERIDAILQKPPQAQLKHRHNDSPARVDPPCPYYGRCGGCDLQHLTINDQREHKDQVVSELLQKFAQLQPQQWATPLAGEPWQYRQRTRLACHWHKRERKLTLGLRAQQSHDIVQLQQCPVLSEPLAALLPELSQLLNKLHLAATLGHVELLAAPHPIVLLRLTTPVIEQDRDQLLEWQHAQESVAIWLQHHDNQVAPLAESSPLPLYQVHSRELSFTPGDFIQANSGLNEAMVTQALEWLDPQPQDRILELFAGTGNFTLAMAAAAASVLAVEGDSRMTMQLQRNARQAGITNISALSADLNSTWWAPELLMGSFDKVLLDPARAGAQQALTELLKLPNRPQRIVYVSCAPDTFARDARLLAEAGYQLQHCGIVDMFPQTHHIETMACFEAH